MRRAIGSMVSLALLALTPAFAHHSKANFLNETIVLQGEVVDFRWANPHAIFSMSVSDASGKAPSAATPSAPIISGPRNNQNSSTIPAETNDEATRAPPSTRSRVMPRSAKARNTADRSRPAPGAADAATPITCAPAAPSIAAAGASLLFEVITHSGVARAD